MQELNYQDMRRLIGHMPRDVFELMRKSGAILGGGYIRSSITGEVQNDIDLFTDDPVKAQELATELRGTRGEGTKTFRTRNAYTVLTPGRVPVQFIHRWVYSTPQELLESFDFTVAMACVWWEDGAWKSAIAAEFYQDLAAKRLVYTQPKRNEDAGGSILRVQKFLKRGYDISPEDLGKVIARLIQGVYDSSLSCAGEDGKAKVITGLLRHVDPLTVIDGLEPSPDSLEVPEP
jgi:hypothetical protein